ncbi:MAG: hypothetical protein ACRDPD_02700 [Streptosporangiaceae bacterium]
MTIAQMMVPTVPFGRIQGRVARLWDPFERNAFMVVVGITGSGKSHLMRYGILPLRSYSRTVVIDVKDDRDSVWAGFGQPVAELAPAFFRTGSKEHPAVWRVIVNRANAQAQLRRIFEQIRSEGHCVLVMDESRSITEREQIGLGSAVENLITEGRGLGVSMIMGAQSTAWAVSALKDQAACLWIGQSSGRDQALALAKIAGYGRDLAPVIEAIPARRWLYRDKWEGAPILALTDSPAESLTPRA